MVEKATQGLDLRFRFTRNWTIVKVVWPFALSAVLRLQSRGHIYHVHITKQSEEYLPSDVGRKCQTSSSLHVYADEYRCMKCEKPSMFNSVFSSSSRPHDGFGSFATFCLFPTGISRNSITASSHHRHMHHPIPPTLTSTTTTSKNPPTDTPHKPAPHTDAPPSTSSPPPASPPPTDT